MSDSPRICLERCDEDIDLLSQLIDNNADATLEGRFDMSDEMLSSDIDDLTSYLCRSSKREYLDGLSKLDDSCMPPPVGNLEMSPVPSGPSHSPLHNSEAIKEEVEQKVFVNLSGTPNPVKSAKPVSIVYLPKSQPCMTKNAVTARENRIRKKKYVQQLESDVHSLKEENSQLKIRISSQDGKIVKLNEQLQYLKSVIANQSTLSALLQNIQNTSEVKLKSSWSLKGTECDSETALTCSSRKNRENSEENQENSSHQKSKPKRSSRHARSRPKSRHEVCIVPQKD